MLPITPKADKTNIGKITKITIGLTKIKCTSIDLNIVKK